MTSVTGRCHSMDMPKLPLQHLPHPLAVLHIDGLVQTILRAQVLRFFLGDDVPVDVIWAIYEVT